MFGWFRRNKPQAAERFAGYFIIRLMHEGMKSSVYEARYEQGAESFAVKAYGSRYDREARRMCRRYGLRSEGQMGRVLNAPPGADLREHPIVQTIEFGNEYGKNDGAHYVILEFLRGHNLKNLIVMHPGEVKGRAVRILKQVAAGLGFMHSRNLVHRDFCPDNVMLVPGWRVKIIDLGFVCPFGRSFEERSGTPTYMAPEQFTARPLTGAADIYSMGCVAYEMLAGRPPFVSAFSADDREHSDRRMAELMECHVHRDPPPLRDLDAGLPRELEEFVMRCLEKKPESRFRDMLEVRGALSRIESARD